MSDDGSGGEHKKDDDGLNEAEDQDEGMNDTLWLMNYEDELDFEPEEEDDNDVVVKEKKVEKASSSHGDSDKDDDDDDDEEQNKEDSKHKKSKRDPKQDKEAGDSEASGEDEESSNERLKPQQSICRFYYRGTCKWGSRCRYAHQGTTDKGNYNTFGPSRPIQAGNLAVINPAMSGAGPDRRGFEDRRFPPKRPRSPSPEQRSIRRDFPLGFNPAEPPPNRSVLGPRRALSPSRFGHRDEARKQRHFDLETKLDPFLLSGPSKPPARTTTATVKEYINSFSGILELTQGPQDRSIPPVAYFHASAVWIVNNNGNPYGPPVKYLEVLGSNVNPSDDGVSLEREFPVGCKLCVIVKDVDSPFINNMALQVWPTTTDVPPTDELVINPLVFERKQEHYLREFHNALIEAQNNLQLVQATFPIFPWQGSGPDSTATVLQVKDDDYGIIEVKGSIPHPFRFFSLFHRNTVWLKDGKRGVEVEFFQDKPLGAMVQPGQEVTLSARSIVTSSGYTLQPSIMELQAVVVSLNLGQIPVGAPKPTMCFGGTGAFGMSPKSSWYYFEQDLANRMNQELVTFLRVYNKEYPDLHPKCLTFVEPKKKTSVKFLKPKVTCAVGQVLDHPNRQCLLVENLDKTWKCLIPAARTLSFHGNVEEAFPLASTVHFNAVLVDEKAPIQYIGTLVWSSREVLPNAAKLDLLDQPPDSHMFQLYRNFLDQNKHKHSVSEKRGCPIYHEVKEAKVLKILNENFGVLVADDTLVLFDTCDLYLDPATTADSLSKKMYEVLKPDEAVMFNATLIDAAADIQYLASAVWSKKNAHLFVHQHPTVIKREAIHEEKVSIFKTVVQSVGHSLVALSKASSEQRDARFDKDVFYAQTCSIKCIFYDASCKDNENIVGGIAQFNSGFGFFLMEHIVNMTRLPAIGSKMKATVKRTKTDRWSKLIPCIVLSLFGHRDVSPQESLRELEKKFETARKKLSELFELTIITETINRLKKKQYVGIVNVTPSTFTDNGSLRIHDEVPYAKLHCMIDEKSGVLESSFDSKNLCYFELEDLNVDPSVDFKDLVALMASKTGIRVQYQAKMINDKGGVQYVSHTNGVQIVGIPQPDLAHIELKDQDFKSDQPVSLRGEKINRYRMAEELYRQGKFMTPSSILDGTYKKKSDLAVARGVISHILNENFGLVYGPSNVTDSKKTFTIFDIYDLYLKSDRTAADDGKTVQDVVPVNTAVFYNACFIDPDLTVSYLATSVWATNNTDVNTPLKLLPRESIQDDKINIFKQVSEACAPVILAVQEFMRERSASQLQDTTDPRQKDIENVYASDAYKNYLRAVPKHSRQARDPTTPDRKSSVSSTEWNERYSSWKSDLQSWGQQRGSTPTSTIKDPDAKLDVLDHEVTGTLLNEVNSKFAILALSNGSKALLSLSRVWINDKPMFGDWRCLRNQFFKIVRVNARRWSGPMGLEFQVAFCHSGMNKMDMKTKNYIYPSAMKAWLSPLLSRRQLDVEAKEFESVSNKKAM